MTAHGAGASGGASERDFERDGFQRRGFAPMWRAQIARLLSEPFLFSLMAGSILLSVASFYTTFEGMKNFMPQVFIAFCITFAIQALLFVTSWRIGFDLAEKRGWPLFTMFVFATCFCGSVFFSWVALFGAINDADLQTRTRATRIHSAVEQTIAELRVRAVERRRTAAAALLETEAFRRWRQDVDRVAEAALGAGDKLEAVLRARADERAEALRRLEGRIGEVRARLESRGAALETDNGALTRLQERRPALLEKIARLRADLDQSREAVVLKEAAMAAEEAGAAGRGRGQGTVWRGLRDERDQLAAAAEGKSRLLAAAEAELAAVDEQIRALRARIGAGGGADDGELSALEAEYQRMLDAGGAGDVRFNLGEEVRRLRENLAAFAARQDLAPFDRAAETCRDLLAQMRRAPELQAGVADLSCDRRSMSAEMNPIDDSARDLAALEAECAADGPKAKPVATLGFAESVAYGRYCLGLSGLEADATNDLRAEIDRLELEEDPNASAFVKTMNGFFGGEKLAYFALAIAVSIDALVLFSGLVGAQNRGVPSAARGELRPLLMRLMQVGSTSSASGQDLDPALARRRLKLILGAAEPVSRADGAARLRRWREAGEARSPEARIRVAALADPAGRAELRRALTICEIDGLCVASGQENGEPVFNLHRGALSELAALLAREARKDARRDRETADDARRAETRRRGEMAWTEWARRE